MNSNPLVSVIIPMFNAEKYIQKTIDSVIDQTYQTWEIIVVDNFSTDRSKDIIKNIKNNKIKLIELTYNSGGPARPRNKGIENATGNYIAFLDADDVWMPNKLKMQMNFMELYNLNFSSTSALNIDENSKIISHLDYLKNYVRRYRNYNLENFIKNKFIYLSSVLIKKELLIPFNEEKDCISVEDHYLWLQLLNNDNIKYKFMHKELLRYRIVNNSVSDRNTVGKQEAKAMYYTLKFILDNNRFDLIRIIKKTA